MKPDFCVNEGAFDRVRSPGDTAFQAFGAMVSLIEAALEKSERSVLVSKNVYTVVVDGVGTQMFSMLFENPDQAERDFILRMTLAVTRCNSIDIEEQHRGASIGVDQYGARSRVVSDALSIAVQLSADGERYFGILSRGEDGLRSGIARLTSEIGTVEASIVVSHLDIPMVYRAAIPILATDEERFFELAADAYPALLLSPTLTFTRLTGGYSGNVVVIRGHLEFLNDNFLTLARSTGWDLPQMMARSTVAFSDEGSETKKQHNLMRQRDVTLNKITVRCSLHTKLSPTRGRIHFHPPVPKIDPARIIIGIFHDHLET